MVSGYCLRQKLLDSGGHSLADQIHVLLHKGEDLFVVFSAGIVHSTALQDLEVFQSYFHRFDTFSSHRSRQDQRSFSVNESGVKLLPRCILIGFVS